MAHRPQPEQQAPPVQRLRVKYAKRGRARFTSHRDFGRAFERALRRAGVPMAYSSGFSPHPRISYANASPTGAASEAEYLEIGLAEVATRAGSGPPSTPHCRRAGHRRGGGPRLRGALADLLTGSRWHVAWSASSPGVQQRAVAAFLAGSRAGGTDDQERAARVRRPGAVVSIETNSSGLIVTLALIRCRWSGRTTSWRPGTRSTTESSGRDPVLTRLTQGRLDPETGDIAEP